MKFPPVSPRRALLATLLGLAFLPLAGRADDLTPPVVANPIANLTVAAGTSRSVISLKKTFALSGVTGQLVRFSTSVGNIDVEVFTQQTPQTAAAFLKYAEATGDNTTGTPSYTDTLIQRVYSGFVGVGGSTIVQGGGFYIDATGAIDQIANRPAIPSEAGIKNTRGTLAMALSSGPDSATGDFFFNDGDNPGLDDTTYGGPFTVFGRIVGDMSVLEAIIALPQRDFTTQLGGAFTNVPLVNFDGTQPATIQNFVYTNHITALPLIAAAGVDAALALKVKNNNPALVTATLAGRKLKLAYAAGQTGTAVIKLFATDSAGSRIKSKFKVTVQ